MTRNTLSKRSCPRSRGKTLEDGSLTISGERRFAFTHKFSLPRDSAGDKVSAHFKDGVLKVYVLKNAAVPSESIGIKVG
jgi:HSP20 family molecular chaperone IbpA